MLIFLFFVLLFLVPPCQTTRGALYRTGRSVSSFEIEPRNQQEMCQYIQIVVPCHFSASQKCLIDKICAVEEDSKKETKNEFLRFGRSFEEYPVYPREISPCKCPETKT